MENILKNDQRITQKKKNINDKEWYIKQLDYLDKMSFGIASSKNRVSDKRRMKINYDLYNNILDISDFEYMLHPYGDNVGDLPANLTNRDIISPKIKTLVGLEIKRPFSFKILAVNDDATTRKEQEYSKRMKEYVTSKIMIPIRQQVELEIAQRTKGKELSQEETQAINQEIEQKLAAMTPVELKKYMEREHMDPAEMLAHQLLTYLTIKENLKAKFTKAWKHSCISAYEVYYVGYMNGEPAVWEINPRYLTFDKHSDVMCIEDSEWAVMEYRMTPSQIIRFFGSELTEKEIDKIYSDNRFESIEDDEYLFSDNEESDHSSIRVIHGVWKGLRKIGFLDYVDINTGTAETMLVNEDYQFNELNGDISIKWEWIPEVHEGWKIKDMYKYLRPLPGQHKDIDNIYQCKLPYIGIVYDEMNSAPTSFIDRMKTYQYYYNIIWYRIELLMSSDKGKLLLLNENFIDADGQNLSPEQWIHFLEASKIGFLNPNAEANRGAAGVDITNAAKMIDMSLASDIQKYMMLADYIDKKCGEAIGVNKNMEGQVNSNEAVGNVRQSVIQSNLQLEPYFELHNMVMRNVLQALIENAKIAYSENTSLKKLSYIMDDMSKAILEIDHELLDNSTYGIFVASSYNLNEIKEQLTMLAHAAMQNQTIEMSAIVKVLKSEGIQEAEEILKVAEKEKQENLQKSDMQKQEMINQMEVKRMDFEKEKMEHAKEMIVLKEEERRKTEIQKQAMFSLGFDTNKDVDNDGVPDVLEVAKFGVDAEIKRKKIDLEKEKLEYQKQIDSEKLKLENKKIAIKRKMP